MQKLLDTFRASQPAPKLIMRERTDNIKLETSYCRNCQHNSMLNIGRLTCVKCEKAK